MEISKILPLAVAIPTMNRPQTLQRTLESYCAADFLPKQIVVVDQSQTTEMQEKNKQLLERVSIKIPQVSYIYQKEPSLTQARNRATLAATQDIIVCSDDDVDVYKDTLKNVYDLFQNSKIAMVAGLNDCSQKTTSKIGYLLGTKSFGKRKIGHVTASMLGRFPEGDIKGEIPTQWAMGFFFAVRTPLLKKWKIQWDENLTSYAYAEDLDFSYNYYKCAVKEQLNCVLSDKVHVKHLGSKEYRIPSQKTTYMYVCHRYYLAFKHGKGWKENLAMLWCNFWMFIFRIVKRQQPKDMLKAMVYCYKNRAKIKKGDLSFQ